MPLLLYTLFFTLRLTVLLFRIGISVRSRKTINPLRESLSARWSQPLTIHDADLRHSPESMSLILASSLWCGTVNQWEGLYADCKWIKKKLPNNTMCLLFLTSTMNIQNFLILLVCSLPAHNSVHRFSCDYITNYAYGWLNTETVSLTSK